MKLGGTVVYPGFHFGGGGLYFRVFGILPKVKWGPGDLPQKIGKNGLYLEAF